MALILPPSHDVLPLLTLRTVLKSKFTPPKHPISRRSTLSPPHPPLIPPPDSPEREIPAAHVDPIMISGPPSGAEQWGTRRNSREPGVASFQEDSNSQRLSRHRSTSQDALDEDNELASSNNGNRKSGRREKTSSLTISTKRIVDIKSSEPWSGGTPGGMSPSRPR